MRLKTMLDLVRAVSRKVESAVSGILPGNLPYGIGFVPQRKYGLTTNIYSRKTPLLNLKRNKIITCEQRAILQKNEIGIGSEQLM